MASHRQADRWVTPAVVVALVVVLGAVTLGVVAGLVYLVSIGKDPEPVLRMVAQVIGALTGPAGLALMLANRQTVAKTERNTGVLARETASLVDVVTEAPRPRQSADLWPETAEQRTAPARPPGRTPA